MKNRSGKWLLSLGLATAVAVGTMAQGNGHHQKKHGDRKDGRYENSGKRNLSEKVYRITQADSVQKAKIKPTVDHAAKRIEFLRASYRKQEKKVLDSLGLQLKPYLKEEQLKKFNDWKDRTEK